MAYNFPFWYQFCCISLLDFVFTMVSGDDRLNFAPLSVQPSDVFTIDYLIDFHQSFTCQNKNEKQSIVVNTNWFYYMITKVCEPKLYHNVGSINCRIMHQSLWFIYLIFLNIFCPFSVRNLQKQWLFDGFMQWRA